MKPIVLLVLIGMAFSQSFDESDPREIIEQVKIYQITKKLGMTSEQAVQFFPKLNEMREIDKQFRQEKIDALHELRNLMNSGASDKEMENVIDEYEEAWYKKNEDQRKKFQEMRKILTPIQQGKYLIFLDEFEAEIRALIQEIKKQR
jgi:Spy/CpxP family protein refolding chaperone